MYRSPLSQREPSSSIIPSQHQPLPRTRGPDPTTGRPKTDTGRIAVLAAPATPPVETINTGVGRGGGVRETTNYRSPGSSTGRARWAETRGKRPEEIGKVSGEREPRRRKRPERHSVFPFSPIIGNNTKPRLKGIPREEARQRQKRGRFNQNRSERHGTREEREQKPRSKTDRSNLRHAPLATHSARSKSHVSKSVNDSRHGEVRYKEVGRPRRRFLQKKKKIRNDQKNTFTPLTSSARRRREPPGP
ncbi:hypothetical protein VTK73DRAFT_6299 [Phialemonium thermophilum]|uniref:Uncharacterized protein n=1 Tax=Phialemonium thermophilum TaxID=223376 RepID=A0ABR3UZP1_9PEZI